METLTTICIAWAIYLIVQALFINGIKLAASGTTEIMPDGTEKDSEMLLYPMSKELLKKQACKIFYKGSNLYKICETLETQYHLSVAVNKNHDAILFNNIDDLYQFRTAQANISKILGVQFDTSSAIVTVYIDSDEYVWSKWIRKPIIGCVVCMASFWGIFTFLVPALVVSHFNWMVLPAYLINTVMLGCVNKIIHRLT
jgi:hypothetical protein